MRISTITFAIVSATIAVAIDHMAVAETLVSYDFTLPAASQGVDSRPQATVHQAAPIVLPGSGVKATDLAVNPNGDFNFNTGRDGVHTGVNHWPAGTYGTSTNFIPWVDYSNPDSGVWSITASQIADIRSNAGVPLVDTSENNKRWFGFTVNVDAANPFNLEQLSFATEMVRLPDTGTGSVGTGRTSVAYSVNGGGFTPLVIDGTAAQTIYTTVTVGGTPWNGNWAELTFDLSKIAELQNFTGTLEFRWYMSTNNSSSVYRAMNFDDIKLEGVAVPEIASLTLLIPGFAICLSRRQR